jgi:diguanylate cyclase (GGDEF)-like protein/PAS domain S-box-containing protein
LKLKRVLIRDKYGEVSGILESGRAFNPAAGGQPEEAPLRSLMEQMPLLLWTTDQNLRITSNWGTGAPSSKFRPGALAGRSVCEFLGCADRHATPIAEHYEALRGVSSHFEYNWKNRVLEIRLEPWRTASGEIIGCLGVGADITDRKKNEEETHYQARHDALTGLANYREFLEKLEQEVRRAERSHHSFTLLLLDLDELKRINDLHGHLAGNRALKRLAAVMKEHCRSTDLAARYGGDEFAVVLIDSDRGMGEQVAQRIDKGLRTDQENPSLSVSIGMGIYPDDGRTGAELIEAADRQLYRRKKAQVNRSVSASR